ncbi:MAG TPA: hypothetical protein IAD45_00240 [Candidatus Faecimonas intestinavium]|nr:hypothetical protein [Candidatus Faecimonas intestinavium]
MNDKKQAENIVPSVENVTTPPEKDLISSEDVLAVVSGDQVALVEQMERAREAALSQKSNAQEIAAEKAKKKLEEEEKKKKAIMDEVKRRKEEALKREKLAKEEAERKKAEAEAERQRQLAEKKRLEEEAKAKAEQERLELERKKQAKEAAIKAKEDAKKAKIQARIDAKKAKQEAKEAAKRAKIEARENARKAKEDAKKARIEAKKAKAQARLDAKKKKNESKESSTVVPQQKVVQPVSPAPIPQPKAVSQPTSVPSQPKVVAPQQKSAVPSQAVTTNSSSTTQNTKSTVADNTKSNPDKKTKKESNLKYYMTFIFFALLIWMVAFLPEISSFVSNYMASKQQEGVPAITTGTLTCTMNTNDDKYDYYYEADFNFKDSKMYRLTFSATTKGDQNLDAIELSGMKSSCDLLQQQTANLEGVEVSCSLSNGVYENVQKLDYEDLKSDLVTTAYLEAGGTYPNYEYGQDINEIEKEMKASNYTCERHS